MSSSVHTNVSSKNNHTRQPSKAFSASEGSRMNSYSDPRFVYNIARLVGNEVEIVTTTGDHLRGILDTFSEEFDVVLKSVQEVVVKDGTAEHKSVPYVRGESSSHTVIIKKDDLVSLTAEDVKQDCEKKPFLDAGISSLLNGNSGTFADRDFVPWEAEFAPSNLDVSLEDGGAGWDSEFMLESFEKSNPGKTSYKGMEQYTNVEVPQDLNEEKVKEIETFVESCSRTSDDFHEDELDDRPEEEKFAAVVRENEPEIASSGEVKRSPSISRCSVDSQASQRSIKFRPSHSSRQWVNSGGGSAAAATASGMLQNRSSDFQWVSTRRNTRPYSQRYNGNRRGRPRGSTSKRNSPSSTTQQQQQQPQQPHHSKYNPSTEHALNYYSDRDFNSAYSGMQSMSLSSTTTTTRSPPNKAQCSSPSSDNARISRTSSRRGSPVDKANKYGGRPSLPANVPGSKDVYETTTRRSHKQLAYRHNRTSHDVQRDRKPVLKSKRSNSREPAELMTEGEASEVKKTTSDVEVAEPVEISSKLTSSNSAATSAPATSTPQQEVSSKLPTQSRSVTPEGCSDLAAKVAQSNLNPLACVFIPHGSANISEVNSPAQSRPSSLINPQVGAVIPQILTGQQNYFATPAQIASPAAMNLVRAQGCSKKAIVSVHTPVIESPIPSIHPTAYSPSFQHPAAFPNMRYVLISEPVQPEQDSQNPTPQYAQGSSSGAATPVPQLVMFGNQPYSVQYGDMIGQPYNAQGPYYIVNPNSAPPYPQIVPCQLAPLNTYSAPPHIPPPVAHSLALQQPQFYHPHVFATASAAPPAPQPPFIVPTSANTTSVTVQVPPLSQQQPQQSQQPPPSVHPHTSS